MSSRLAAAGLCALLVAATALAVLRVVVIRRIQPESPLARAAAAGDGERLRALARSGAALDAPDTNGFTALDWAARDGRVEAIRALVAAGADPDARDSGPSGWTALLHAVHKRQDAAVRALLAAGANPNARARHGSLALIDAAMRSNLAQVEILLTAGADPLLQANGRTALTNAVAGGSPAVVRALRRKAPTLRLRDTLSDHLAVWMARLTGHGEALAALREEGGTSSRTPKGLP